MYNLLTLLFCYITEKKMFIPNKTLTDLLQVLTILPLLSNQIFKGASLGRGDGGGH